ncbi:MAG: hypothetical protein H7177_05935 [Rhizobacter sp.]|nr:hypothetical protein [Bacteriovorax sp.]
MKYILLTLIISSPAFSKEVFNYTCPVDKNLRVEISILDSNSPTIDLFNKKSKFATCVYENTPESHKADPRAMIQDAIWQLKLKNCNYYFEKEKDKIHVDKTVSFKQAKKGPSYLAVIENAQPLTCAPKK